MNWKRTASLALVVCFAALVGVGCDKAPTVPDKPTGPDTTYVGVRTTYTTVATAAGEIKYAFDWGDKIDTSGATASGTVYSANHTWTTAGTVNVKAMALLSKSTGKASAWSEAKSVVVLPNDAPIIDSIRGPVSGYAAKETDIQVRVWAHDPEGDSLLVYVQWKTSKTDSSASLLGSPARDSFFYSYSDTGTVWIKAWAKDKKSATSAVDSFKVVIGEAGGVVWYWWNADQSPLTTTPVVFFDGTDTVVGSGCEDDYFFYTIKVNSRRFGTEANSRQPKYASDDYYFAGHAAFCSQTNHVIVSSDEGEIYGLSATLGHDWQWPDSSVNGLTDNQFGPVAISQNKIFAPREDDRALYGFVDNGTSVALAYGPLAFNSTIMDGPVLDASNDVIFGTDSGFLYLVAPPYNSATWRLSLQSTGEVYGPVIGADGTIYCGTDQQNLVAVNPTTQQIQWTYALSGVGMRPVVGATAVYIGTDRNVLYAINFNGGLVWQKTLGDQITTAPILVTGGYMYVQTDNEMLYCLAQSDGSQIWSLDCSSVLPTSAPNPRPMGVNDFTPSPTITGRGNVIVVGERATYCVKGYPDKVLDTSVAWPKWMKDVYNTGK